MDKKILGVIAGIAIIIAIASTVLAIPNSEITTQKLMKRLVL